MVTFPIVEQAAVQWKMETVGPAPHTRLSRKSRDGLINDFIDLLYRLLKNLPCMESLLFTS
jgi:hypothetical protein